jgi:hypothetical protein
MHLLQKWEHANLKNVKQISLEHLSHLSLSHMTKVQKTNKKCDEAHTHESINLLTFKTQLQSAGSM